MVFMGCGLNFKRQELEPVFSAALYKTSKRYIKSLLLVSKDFLKKAASLQLYIQQLLDHTFTLPVVGHLTDNW